MIKNKGSAALTAETLRQDGEVKNLIDMTDKYLCEIGYTEHGFRHLAVVGERAEYIFKTLGKCAEETRLLKIAALLHDIGNVINRNDHPISGAILAQRILSERGMDLCSTAKIMTAIGNHDEAYGTAVSDISAALILADKSDVHFSRVRHIDKEPSDKEIQDIHDRVNAAVRESNLEINTETKEITLILKLAPEISSPMDYFEIFLKRMQMCKTAAQYLGFKFRLKVNDYFLA